MNPITTAFFGISGSGKGTQVELLEKYLRQKDSSRGIWKPGMGDLARAFMQTGSPLADQTKRILAEGGLLPSFIPIYLLTQSLEGSFDGTQHVIFEGTCRRPDQSRAANDMMRLWGRADMHAINLVLSKEQAKARLVARGRFDDASDEAIENRFSWYQEQVVPALEELRTLGWQIHDIDGEPDVDTIHQNIRSVLGLAG